MDIFSEDIKPITARQKMAMDIWIRDGRKSKAEAMRKAGYSKAMCRQPHKVFDSLAVKRELFLYGYGYDGKELKSKPKAIVIETPKRQEQKIDFSAIPREKIQELQELLDSVPPSPAMLKRMARQREEQNTSQPVKNDPNCNIFGERLPNAPEPKKYTKMSDFSSI